MDIATRDAPGVSNQFNWITDIGGPVDPNSLNSIQLPTSWVGTGPFLFWFTLNNLYNTDTSNPSAPSDPPMTFNRMGILGGPLKTASGATNVGGVVTIFLQQWSVNYYAIGQPFQAQQIAQASVNMTTWTPGQFYWSDPLSTSVNIWGSMGFWSDRNFIQSQTQFYYSLAASCTVPYSVYANRPVILRNGLQWGSSLGVSHNPTNDHLFAGGPVDLNYNVFKDLGTASLAPSIALSSTLHRKAGMSFAPISPQITLSGRVSRRGVFEGVSAMEPMIVLSAAPMAGGPLWKPSKLCTG